MKNPIIAGVLNFFLPGAGYLYVGGKKKIFGAILLISFILLYSTAFLSQPPQTPAETQSITQPLQIGTVDQLGVIAAFLLLFAFAYDAYNEALKRK
jgi:hypothetical protein